MINCIDCKYFIPYDIETDVDEVIGGICRLKQMSVIEFDTCDKWERKAIIDNRIRRKVK